MRKKEAKLLSIALCMSVLAMTGCSQSDKKDSTGETTKKVAQNKNTDKTEQETETKAQVYGTAGELTSYDTEKSNYTLNIDSSIKVHDISELLYGIFIEDINFAADGGLYAELVQNRSFEFTNLASDNEKHAWSDVATITNTVIKGDTAGCLNENNPNYLVMENASSEAAGIANSGWLDGMAVTQDENYKFSIYAKGMDGYTGALQVAITNGTETLAEGSIPAITADWKKYELTLTPSATADKNVKLQVTMGTGKAAIDMVSLFP